MKLGTEKTIISVDYNDVEQLIKKIYGHFYEIMPCEEVGSSQYAATYTQRIKKEKLFEYDLETVAKFFKTGEGQFILHNLMTDMCNNGHIEEGEYIIDVNW